MTKEQKEPLDLFDLVNPKPKPFKHSLVLAYSGWASVFGIIWLLILGVIVPSGETWFFLTFSFGIAFSASLFSVEPKRGSNNR